MAENVYEFTDQNFDTEVLQSEHPVLVDFWAEWCGPCKVIGPVVEEIATDYKNRVKVGKLNVDHNQQTAMKYGIRSIPSLLVFKNGDVLNQVVGSVPKERITKLLDEAL
ncbi:MAG: thioredoxin [Candidatus Neomarinimicrobiota bacterium]|nr:MAG: thioredoxin [Candidatus Neomarinimicrobiota bacterium]